MDVDPQQQTPAPPPAAHSPESGTPAAAAALMDFAAVGSGPLPPVPSSLAPAASSSFSAPAPAPPAPAPTFQAPAPAAALEPSTVAPPPAVAPPFADLLAAPPVAAASFPQAVPASPASVASEAPQQAFPSPSIAPPPPPPATPQQHHHQQQGISPMSIPPPPPAQTDLLPPPPTDVHPSHPLAPPPQPFADAQPTSTSGVTFDPPSAVAPPNGPLNGLNGSASLKRDEPHHGFESALSGAPGLGGGHAFGDLLNATTAGGQRQAQAQDEEHAAKRAKLESVEEPAFSAPVPPQQQQQQQPTPVPSPSPQPQSFNAPPPQQQQPQPAPTPVQTAVASAAYPVEPYAAPGGQPAQYALPQPQQQQQPQVQPWEAPPASYVPPPASLGGPTAVYPPAQSQAQQPQWPAGSFAQSAHAYGAVPPPHPAAPSSNGHPSSSASTSLPLSQAQQKFFLNLVRSIKKLPQAYAFSAPVDPVAMGIPHYPQIVTHPMDLSTIEAKLQASGPKGKSSKKGVGKYKVKDEVIEDFKRVWENSDRFNGREHAVSQAGRALEEVFEKSLTGVPADEEAKPPTPKPAPSYSASPFPGAQGLAGDPRRESLESRPKRDVHPPPHKDVWDPAGRRKSGGKKGKYDEQFRFLRKEIEACFKGKGAELCWPFLAPVDPVAMNIPEYPTIVKRPMDLSTVRSNLLEGAYDEPSEINSDVKLMLRNCFAFNPPGTAVYDAGKMVESYWQGRWRMLPPLQAESDEEPEVEEPDSAEEEINQLTGQMAALQKRLDAARARRAKKKAAKKASVPTQSSKPKAPKPTAPKQSFGGPSTSSHSHGPPKPKKQSVSAPSAGGPSSGQPKKQKKKADEDDDPALSVSMAQKQELADKIQHADGDILTRAIGIIQDSVGDNNGSEEIELDIDSLPPAVVLKLYNLVVRGPRKKPSQNKSNRAGTGGLSRKSMNEDVESAKIALLEEKMRAFESGGGGGAGGGGGPVGGGGQGEMDDSDESGSDSASDSD